MNVKEIVKDIYYVGVNDRVTEKFEALWALPNGVSYNSYVVKDAKNALIDTVEVTDAPVLLNHIRRIIGDAPLHYLVINHMEPDHSGSIPVVLEAYPAIKIVGNKQTIGMVKGFYHIENDDRFIEVADGAELSLGEKTFKFLLTPMVHWPETMMTYCPERELIFSGDAFGTFGALNGGIIDYETDIDVYIREMYRYYGCIVGKYGKFVQKALEKVAPLKLSYVCSTHGPVWHERIAEVSAIVDRLSRYEPEAGVTIIYASMYGNTTEVAEAIANELANLGVKNIKIHNAAKADMSDMISDAFRYEGLIVGAPTYSMTLFPPVATFMRAMVTREVKNKVFAAFGSFTWAPAALKKIEGYANQLGWNLEATLLMKQSITDEVLADCRSLAEAVHSKLTLK